MGEATELVLDDRRLSALEAGVAAYCAIFGPRFSLARGESRYRGALARLRALTLAARDIPRDLVETLWLYSVLRRESKRTAVAPALRGRPRSVLYVRPEPRVLHHGQWVGGAATHTEGVVSGFRDLGIEVELIVPQATGIAGEVVVEAGRPHHLLPKLGYIERARRLERELADRSPDIVYSRHAIGSDAAVRIAAALGVPCILEYNGSGIWVHEIWGERPMRMRDQLIRIEQATVRGASLVTAVSENLLPELHETGIDPNRIVISPNGTDVEQTASLARSTPAEARARLGRVDAPTVGFIGTFGSWHGAPLLPGIAARVRDSVPETRWIVIGTGAQWTQTRALADRSGLDERFELCGALPRPEALEALAACDVLISPHVPNEDGAPFIGSPTKLVEYLALGRPVVASALGQIADTVRHDHSGLLVSAGDEDELAAAVVELLTDPGRAARLGQNARADAEANHSWSAHVERILVKLDELSGSAGGDPGSRPPDLLGAKR